VKTIISFTLAFRCLVMLSEEPEKIALRMWASEFVGPCWAGQSEHS